jgi:hypothetical protein
MLHLAQCEKAVTISELMGNSRQGGTVPMGSKTPIGVEIPGRARSELRFLRYCLSTSFHLVFNDLPAEKARFSEKFGGHVHPIQEGNVVSIQGAQFGPNFVTIQPTGVCACSI